ncbi:unnamed protein product [Symbiodinium sp. CCMP2456]|nr:unnamed protein product [Symbiodinium sp. CCMP2456]
MWLTGHGVSHRVSPEAIPPRVGCLRFSMKQSALLGLLGIALLLPCATARKLGSTSSALQASGLARGHEGARGPLDLDALEVSVLRLTNSSESSRSYLKPMIDSIRTMLEKELMPDISRQYSLAQKMLDDAAKGFAACKEPWNATQVGEVREQHQNCRKEESSLVVDANDTCDDAQVLAEVKVQKCEKMKGVDAYPPEAPAVCDKDSSDVSYEVHARRVRNFYMQKVHEWVMAEEECTNATQKATARSKTCKVRNDGWKDKRQSCNAIQRMLDMEACDAWTEYYHCSQNNSCLLEATNAFVDANGTATAMQRSIVLQWRAMKRIECLLDALENNRQADDLSNAITECRNKVHSTTSWALTYPYYKAAAWACADAAPRGYRQKVRFLATSLKRPENSQLLRRLLEGEVPCREVVLWPEEEFLGEAQKKQRLKDREDALAEILLKAKPFELCGALPAL